MNFLQKNKTGLRPVSRTALGQVLKWGHGPGHWQGMVHKVIVAIMVFMIVIGNMDNIVNRDIMGIILLRKKKLPKAIFFKQKRYKFYPKKKSARMCNGCTWNSVFMPKVPQGGKIWKK